MLPGCQFHRNAAIRCSGVLNSRHSAGKTRRAATASKHSGKEKHHRMDVGGKHRPTIKMSFSGCTTDLLDLEGESNREAVSRICKAANFGQVVIGGFRLRGQ